MITKEQLTGIKVKLGDKEDWDYLSNLCKSLGLEQATWGGCDFNVNSTAFVSGWEGRFLATHYWEDGDETSDEFTNLRVVLLEDVKKIHNDKDKGEEEMETKDIDWSQAPEGYDYWIIYDETVQGTFYKNSVRYGYPAFEDRKGMFVFEDSEDLVIYKRPEPVTEDKKIIKKYIREEFNTRGQALDSYDSGVVFYTPSNDGYSVVDETGILDHFGQLFTLEEREETWQDAAQEFIKNDPVLSGDKFVEDMFGDDFTEYHEPMRQLAKIIVEKSGD